MIQAIRDQAPPFCRDDLARYPGALLEFDDIHHGDAAANRTAYNGVTHAGRSFSYHRPALVGAPLPSLYHINKFIKAPRSSSEFRLTALQQRLPHEQQRPLAVATATPLFRNER